MRSRYLALLALIVPAACSSSPGDEAAPPAVAELPSSARVDPFVGTDGFGYSFGSAFVGALAPNGLAKLGPDTRGPAGTLVSQHYSGYWHQDDELLAVSHLHLHGTGATDYGVLGVMPLVARDPAKRRAADHVVKMDKATEQASPGRYAVTLANGVGVELGATTRVGVHRYTFPAGSDPWLFVDLAHHLSGGAVKDARLAVEPGGRRVTGKLRSLGAMSDGFGGYDVYFDMRLRTPFADHVVTTEAGDLGAAGEATGDEVAVALHFPTATEVEVAVGLSLVDADGATKNLEAEVGDARLSEIVTQTAASFRALTDKVRVYGGDERDRTAVKTGVYHAYMMPSVTSDVDGRFTGPDGAVHVASLHRQMSDLSLWDTYRTLHPFYDLVSHDVARDAAQSLIEFAKIAGYFPRWPIATGEAGTMLGSSAEIVLADAVLKGVPGVDGALAYSLLRPAAMDPVAPPGGRGGRSGVDDYLTLGYVPATVGRSVSLTVEFAHDDFALSNLALLLGREDDRAVLAARRRGYMALFDESSGTLRSRTKDGALAKPDSRPDDFTSEFAEANATQTVWGVPHDALGLAALMGGPDAMAARLDGLFEASKATWEEIDPGDSLRRGLVQKGFWPANEPCLHMPYLFAQIGRPALTQRWVRWVLSAYFSERPDGLPGNDDGGTMSTFLVFSSLGLYPLAGSARYTLGSPVFPRAEIDVPGGTFTIVADGASRDAVYVQSVTLDGAPVTRPELHHSDLRPGRVLRFVMGTEPSSWGTF
ncbi:MAG: GH92 family glycosyl hydrolase [Polyangiaceae bacterium]|nr:GH92 family glycosyl hydrolase [Polyangiaceae bacterium]